jgi:hypothetical protein
LNLKLPAILAVLLFTILAQNYFGALSSTYAYPSVTVTTDSSTQVTSNPLSLGVMIDHEWKNWVGSSTQQQLVKDASIKLVRMFDFRKTTNPVLMPVKSWSEKTQTGVFDWTAVDSLVQKIIAVGAEPLICIGYARSSNMASYIPPGMAVNSATGLPNPKSYAAYAAQWVIHFKNKGWSVRYYEVFNEPFSYFGWTPNTVKLGYFKDLWNTCARAMRSANPNVLLSFDFTLKRQVFDYWLKYGDDINFLDTHTYTVTDGDSSFISDATIFSRAEVVRTKDDSSFYAFSTAKQKWLAARGKSLTTIISETNLNVHGTDTRNQQMANAVRMALMIRSGILYGLNYYTLYSFASNPTYASGGGNGFGMVNSATSKPWYPYYAYKIIGPRLSVGDKIVKSGTTDTAMRSIAWIHSGKTYVLIINMDHNTKTITLDKSAQFTYQKIDETYAYTSAKITEGTGNTLTIKGYTVAVLQKSS